MLKLEGLGEKEENGWPLMNADERRSKVHMGRSQFLHCAGSDAPRTAINGYDETR
jgi:hypothetical protein